MYYLLALKAAKSTVFVHLLNFGQLNPLAVVQAKGGSGSTRVKTLFTPNCLYTERDLGSSSGGHKI